MVLPILAVTRALHTRWKEQQMWAQPLLQGFAVSKGEPVKANLKFRILSTNQCPPPQGSFGYVACLSPTGSSFLVPPFPALPLRCSPRGFCMDSGMPACFLWAPLKEHLRFFVAAHLVLYLSGAAGVGPQLPACVCSWLLGGHSCLFAWMEEQGQYEM